jgi:hypothetical protein
MKPVSLVLLVVFFVSAGCATTGTPELTPLEIQSLQTREYEYDKEVVFPSVMSVFQDLGYTIKSADKDTGLITAESAATSDAASKFWLGVSKVAQTCATAFIEEIGTTTRVRLSFVVTNETSYSRGQTDRQDTPILNAEAYRNAFERIENAIFVRSAN